MTAPDDSYPEFAQGRTRADARERSWRTFLNGLSWDVVIALAPLMLAAFTAWDGAFTAVYWSAVGSGLLKTLGMAVAAYILRYVKKPKNSV